MARKVWDGIAYPFLNFNGAYFIIDVITYPGWDQS